MAWEGVSSDTWMASTRSTRSRKLIQFRHRISISNLKDIHCHRLSSLTDVNRWSIGMLKTLKNCLWNFSLYFLCVNKCAERVMAWMSERRLKHENVNILFNHPILGSLYGCESSYWDNLWDSGRSHRRTTSYTLLMTDSRKNWWETQERMFKVFERQKNHLVSFFTALDSTFTSGTGENLMITFFFLLSGIYNVFQRFQVASPTRDREKRR